MACLDRALRALGFRRMHTASGPCMVHHVSKSLTPLTHSRSSSGRVKWYWWSIAETLQKLDISSGLGLHHNAQ